MGKKIEKNYNIPTKTNKLFCILNLWALRGNNDYYHKEGLRSNTALK